MNEALMNISSGLAAAVKAASPAVVRVEGRRRLPASRHANLPTASPDRRIADSGRSPNKPEKTR